MKVVITAIAALGLIAAGWFLMEMVGSGGFKRLVTLTGVYAVCKPGGYEAVCFLDADSKQGGLSCLPLTAVGGECRR